MRNLTPHTLPKTIKFFPSKAEYTIPPLYFNMFTEDIYHGVMPYRFYRHDEDKFKIEVSGTEKEVELVSRLFKSLCDNDYRNIQDSISKAIENIARQIVWENKAHYEIILGDDPACPYLFPFTSKRLFKLFNCYIQSVPPKDFQLRAKRFIAIRSKYVWVITFPRNLGGANKFKRITKKLSKINPYSPNFAKSNIVETINMPGYNFMAYNRLTNIIINRIVKKWGWNRRDTTNDYSTDYYRMYKNVSFKYSQALLREHIIEELNKLLKRLGINSSIILSGITTSKEILSIREKLFNREIPLRQIFDLI